MDHFTLDKQGNFIVKESILINLISAGCFYAMLAGVFFTIDFNAAGWASSFLILFAMLFIFGTVFLVKAARGQVILTINKEGIYYKGQFITGWDQFIVAYITLEELTSSDSSSGLYDQFSL